MNNDTNQENSLKVIRYIQENVEGLKERIDYINNHQALRSETQAYLISITEVQLNHLLLAIRASKKLLDARLDLGVGRTKPFISGLYSNTSDFHETYDLTKTVEENLKSNPELTNYLLDLFQLTTNKLWQQKKNYKKH